MNKEMLVVCDVCSEKVPKNKCHTVYDEEEKEEIKVCNNCFEQIYSNEEGD